METKKIYIAGKITGDIHYKDKFAKAVEELAWHKKNCGPGSCRGCLFYDRDYMYGCIIRGAKNTQLAVVNPAAFPIEGLPWLRCMAYCLRRLRKCDYIYMLPDWEESRGARLEHQMAKWLNIKIIYAK